MSQHCISTAVVTRSPSRLKANSIQIPPWKLAFVRTENLQAEVFSPYSIVNGDPTLGIVLLSDHAGNNVPDGYGTLGLPLSEFERHIAYDIEAKSLTYALAERLGCPAVHSCFSRLLIDPNRGEDDPTILMRLSDGTVVPGNRPISEFEINSRIKQFHAPYHAAIDRVLDKSIASGANPMVFSIHSFTPRWKAEKRPWEAAIFWDSDPRLSSFMIEGLRRDETLTVGDNEPYDGALKNDTMYRHCTVKGLAHALLEVRQDLIINERGVAHWADILAPLLEEANALSQMHEIRNYRSRTGRNQKEFDNE